LYVSEAFSNTTGLLSLGLDGNSAQGFSFVEDISADGRVVVFSSGAANLVVDDTNDQTDLFMVDPATRVIERINVSSQGDEAVYGDPEEQTPQSGSARVSGDNRFIVYESNALNLVEDDTNDLTDIFLWDRESRTTSRVSVSSAGQPSMNGASFHPDISENGQFVVFNSYAADLIDGVNDFTSHIYLRDLATGDTRLISRSPEGLPGDGDSQLPSISADGQFIVYVSSAENLVESETTNLITDVFVYDAEAGTTEKVNLSSMGVEANANSSIFASAPAISADGRFVAFASQASNLVSNDTNGQTDVFVRDRLNDTTRRVSVSSSGRELTIEFMEFPDIDISDDAQFVTFDSSSPDLVEGDSNNRNDVFIHELSTGITSLVSENTEFAYRGRINADGRFVTYSSDASDPQSVDNNGAFDVYLLDRGAECDITEPSHQFSLANNEYELLSLPCDVPPGTTVSDLFEDDIGAPYGIPNWLVYIYDPSIGSGGNYANIGPNGTLVPGQGFWIIQVTGEARTLVLPEGSREVATSTADGPACLSTIGCKRLPLSGLTLPIDQATGEPIRARWNLLGNPFNVEFGLPISTFKVTTAAGTCSVDNGGCTLDEAVQPSIDVSPNLVFRYSLAIRDYEPLTSDSNINSWDGLWVGELSQAAGNSPALVIPLIDGDATM